MRCEKPIWNRRSNGTWTGVLMALSLKRPKCSTGNGCAWDFKAVNKNVKNFPKSHVIIFLNLIWHQNKILYKVYSSKTSSSFEYLMDIWRTPLQLLESQMNQTKHQIMRFNDIFPFWTPHMSVMKLHVYANHEGSTTKAVNAIPRKVATVSFSVMAAVVIVEDFISKTFTQWKSDNPFNS